MPWVAFCKLIGSPNYTRVEWFLCSVIGTLYVVRSPSFMSSQIEAGILCSFFENANECHVWRLRSLFWKPEIWTLLFTCLEKWQRQLLINPGNVVPTCSKPAITTVGLLVERMCQQSQQKASKAVLKSLSIRSEEGGRLRSVWFAL